MDRDRGRDRRNADADDAAKKIHDKMLQIGQRQGDRPKAEPETEPKPLLGRSRARAGQGC